MIDSRESPEVHEVQEGWSAWLSPPQQSIVALLVGLGLVSMSVMWCVERIRHGPQVLLDDVQATTQTFQLNVNEADWPEWMLLPGISETLARHIVEHRSTHGPFRSPEDLLDVRGLGPRSLDRIGPYLRFLEYPSAPSLPQTAKSPLHENL